MKKMWMLCAMIVTFFVFSIIFIATLDKTSSQHNGIYVRIGHSKVYSIGLVNQSESLGMCNADGSSMQSKEWICLQENNLEDGQFVLSAYGKDDELICRKIFHYLGEEKRISITINEEGQFLETID